MKVKSLIAKLSHANPEDEVCLSLSGFSGGSHNPVTGTKWTEIKDVYIGFDWDAGKVYLQPKSEVELTKLPPGGGAVGHLCKDSCVCCSTHHALEILACYALEGRFGKKQSRTLGDIMPYKEIKITPRGSSLKP
ncbi:MAG: hypothetical protein KCHDKBKB_00644 [Elusimicrobia bacterium]|nr:hypothetical protein [Elusimicrobiota bacterium]